MAHRGLGNEKSQPGKKGSKLEWAANDLLQIQSILGKTSYKDFRDEVQTNKKHWDNIKNDSNAANFAATQPQFYDAELISSYYLPHTQQSGRPVFKRNANF